MTEAVTEKKDPKASLMPPWKPGVSPNPGGKPVAARNSINAKFLNALITSFEEGVDTPEGKIPAGLRAIRACRDGDPPAYVRALVALQPKELEISRPLDDIPDDQLAAVFAAVGAILAAQDPREGDCAPGGSEATAGVPAVPEAG